MPERCPLHPEPLGDVDAWGAWLDDHPLIDPVDENGPVRCEAPRELSRDVTRSAEADDAQTGQPPAAAPAADPEAPICRPVELDDGSVVRVQGVPDGEVPPELTAALTDVVDAVKRRHAAEHPPAVRPVDAGPDQCPRSDVHGPHRWRHKGVARQCPGLPVTQCRAEYPGSGQHGARIVACGRPRGHEGDHVEYIGDDAGPSWPATPPGRSADKIGTTEWQRQNAAEVRAEQADEIRAAIDGQLRLITNNTPVVRAIAERIYDRVFKPLTDERDEQRQRAERAEELAATRGQITDQTINASAELFTEIGTLRSAAESLMAERDERDATIAELRAKLDEAEQRFESALAGEDAAERDRDEQRQRADERTKDLETVNAELWRAVQDHNAERQRADQAEAERDDQERRARRLSAELDEVTAKRDWLREELARAEYANRDGRAAVDRVRELANAWLTWDVYGDKRGEGRAVLTALDGTDGGETGE